MTRCRQRARGRGRRRARLRGRPPAAARSRSSNVARAIFDARASSIFLLDEEADELVLEAVSGEGEGEIVGLRFPSSTGIAGWVLVSRQPLVIDDVSADPRWARNVAERTGYVPKGLMAVPLLHEERTLGVLYVLDRRDDVRVHARRDRPPRRIREPGCARTRAAAAGQAGAGRARGGGGQRRGARLTSRHGRDRRFGRAHARRAAPARVARRGARATAEVKVAVAERPVSSAATASGRLGDMGVDQLEQRGRDHVGRRRTARHAQIDRKDSLDGSDDVVTRAQQPAAEGAVPDCSDEPRLRHRAVGREQRLVHAGRHGPGDEE